MASAGVKPGDFVLEVADTGTSLMNAFTKFLAYRKVSDNSLENLYATISITTSLLRELGATINKYENDFPIKDDVIKPTVQKCKDNFDRLLAFINEGTSQGIWKNDGTLGGEKVTAEVDPWFLITIGIGGWEEAEIFWKSLNVTRDTLVRLKDTIKYMILKELSAQNLLQLEQVQEFRAATALLPHLVQNFEQAEKKKKLLAEQAAKDAERNLERDASAWPDLRRTDSDSFSDITLPVNHERNGRQDRVKDIDCDSIYSAAPPAPRRFEDTEEVYEEWLLRYTESKRSANRSRGFLGLRVKEYYEDPGFWSTSAELRSQAEMKEQHHFAAGDMSAAKHMAAMQKIIQKLPKEGGRQIDALIKGRTDFSSSESVKRQWTVVAVRPQQKYPYSSGKKFGKDPNVTNWLITIRGETLDTIQRARPYLMGDAWIKEVNYDYRPFSPIGRRRSSREDRYVEPMVHIPHRNHSHLRVEPLPLRGDAVNEKIQSGTLVVGTLMSQADAEQKIEKIWEFMNKETCLETIV